MFKSDIACADTWVKWILGGQIQLSGVFTLGVVGDVSLWFTWDGEEKMDTTNYTTTNWTMNVNN